MVYVYVGPWSAAATAEETTDAEKAIRRTMSSMVPTPAPPSPTEKKGQEPVTSEGHPITNNCV